MLHVDEGHKLLEPTLAELSDLYSWIKGRCCPLNKSYRILWNLHNDPLNFLAMSDRRQTRNGQMLLHVFAPATSRKGLLSFWWRVLCKYSVRLISFILLHPFISFRIILVKNPCISYHVISSLAALFDLIWRNDPYADKWYDSIFVRLAASEFYHLHLRSVWWMILDILPARKILKEGGVPWSPLWWSCGAKQNYSLQQAE